MGSQLKRSTLFCLFVFVASYSIAHDTLNICSFNIQFLGHFKDRNNEFLAEVLSPFDIVVIQEMVAPPMDGVYPNGLAYKQDLESASFVKEMTKQGFQYWLSEEDTGPSRNHLVSTASEWWISFYRPDKVIPDSSRAYGFLSKIRAANPTFERVPYAFPFSSIDGTSNFTLISTHLRPGDGSEDIKKRNQEINGVVDWIKKQTESNRDYYLLGDCNIYTQSELKPFSEIEFNSLNSDFHSTNTKMYEDISKGKAYDHVFYTKHCAEEILPSSFTVVDLFGLVQKAGMTYTPYNHDQFRTTFSDHVPISYQIITGKDSDL